MPPSPLDHQDPELGRKRFLLRVAVAIFIASGVALLILPMPLPRPLRLTVAGIDFLAAAIIWLLGRQRYR